MDAQYAFTSRDDLWRILDDLKELHSTQIEQADRIARLERRRDEDARLKSVWGPLSPFPSSVSIPTEPAFNSPPDAFKGFDQGQQHGMSSSAIGLDGDEEPRRGASRANSVRFDESAIHGYYGQASRSSTELPIRTGSGMSSLPLTERSLSHRSDGRLSFSGHSHLSARTNSLGLDSTNRLLGSSFTESSPLTPPPGWFLLGPVPCIIRCWLTPTFSNETLLYAAVCSGSYMSSLGSSTIYKLGLEESVYREEGQRYIKLPVHLAEASICQASSRSGSPDPHVPAVTVRFLMRESDNSDDSIEVIIGSDVLRAHGADILLSKDKVLMVDDERNRISIPLVRPEKETVFKNLCTSSNGTSDHGVQNVPVANGKDTSGAIGQANVPHQPTYQSISAPASTRVSVGDADEAKKPRLQDHVPENAESRPTTGNSTDAHTGTSQPEAATVWGSWRRPKLETNSAADKGTAGRTMKVLRPTKTLRAVSSTSTPTTAEHADHSGSAPRSATQLSPDETTSTPTSGSNPIGGASAFPWLNSSSSRSTGTSR
ncbi:hypothetical protein N7478_002836 [Penicillium angulare]|uniref:uncharacterized protein n=1 Tax=Penicillium angulare TaxID=116970 RepID=UPI0025412A04|nr:uncharacterized protein N7478_002836 [Penicillium angulare]KAJ5287150.1 hypothetical protein N7478_002836 [Penicillium angulare]